MAHTKKYANKIGIYKSEDKSTTLVICLFPRSRWESLGTRLALSLLSYPFKIITTSMCSTDTTKTRVNILCVHGLEMAPDTTKVHKTIIVIPCCASKSWQPHSTKPFCYMQTKLQSFSNHNRKPDSVCPRYKMSENHTWYICLS